MQRVAKRHAIDFYTSWLQLEPYGGETEDISHNGMKFVSEQAVHKGQLLKIDCEVCSTIAEVTHCEKKRSGLKVVWTVGVAFVTLQFNRQHGNFVSTIA